MGISITRVSDISTGICFAHKTPRMVIGINSTGSSNVFSDGLPISRVGDIAIFSCGHIGMIVSGSNKSTVNGIGISRVGDAVMGTMTATLISGSGKTTTI